MYLHETIRSNNMEEEFRSYKLLDKHSEGIFFLDDFEF